MKFILKKTNLFLTIILFVFTAIGVWNYIYKTHLSGDENHYLVIANAIANYGEVELTKSYTEVANIKDFYAPNYKVPPPAEGKDYLLHSLYGPHGLYSIHNLGLPFIIAPIYKIYGISGVKVFMILLFSMSIVLLWKFMDTLKVKQLDRILLIIATIYAFPFITAANQIYPSLPASLISLLSIIWLIHRVHVKSKKLLIYDFGVLLLIAYQPWLQIKFLAPALVSTLAIILANIKYKNNLKIVFLFMPILLSIILLALYNIYAFDNITGPYIEGRLIVKGLVVNETSLMVLLGLHIDQFQGVFLQNPLMFVGLLFLIPFFKWNWKIATLTLLLYLSFVVPNSMHPLWYGGYSYAGRFAWASSLIWMIPTIFGLLQIKKIKASIFYILLVISFLLQIYFISKFVYSDFSLYNSGEKLLETVNTFYAPLQHYFPSFSNVQWAYRYGTNYAYIFLFLSMIFVGTYYNEYKMNFFKKIFKWYFSISILLIFFVSLISSSTPPIFLERTYKGNQLPTIIGQKDTNFISATPEKSRGYITHGPYIELPVGNYEFTIEYSSSENNTSSVGNWDVVLGTSNVLDKGTIFGTNNKNELIVKSFNIPKNNINKILSIRTFYNGLGSLTIKYLKIKRITYPR